VTTRDVLWRGEPGVELAGDEIEIVVLPRRGAKIASLRHRLSRREWLLQPQGELGNPPPYGSAFTEADMFGWDEMLPTIIGCAYPDGHYRGTPLPDHGEVWTLPWETGPVGEALVCWTTGRVLPYRLTRTMRVDGSRLQLDYELAATDSTPLWLLWAAHPQFLVAAHGTRIVLPAEVCELVDVTPGRQPETVQWPSPDAESSLGLPKGAGRKLYLLPDAGVGAASLIDADGPWLRLAWDPKLVPYLGIWLDNGAYVRHPVIALEPSTGYYDNLTVAVSNQRLPQIHPGQPLRWSVEVSLGRGQLP
jgi:galactose mutarotase-like enzyme